MDSTTMDLAGAIGQATSLTMWTLSVISGSGAVALLVAVGCLIVQARSATGSAARTHRQTRTNCA